MPNPFSIPGFSHRASLRLLVPALLAGFCGAAAAQTTTPPQLLPYTSKLIAGGGTATIASGATCPVSGFTSTDAYGDGCLATEIEIGNTAVGGTTPGSRNAVGDNNGNVFFTDYVAGLVRRVDVSTGIVTVVAGGGTAAAGTSAGALGTAVKLSHPAGIAFAPNGDLYFSDPGNGQVFKIAATNNFITTTGIITLVAGNSAGTYGYAASNATTVVTVANSYLRGVYGIAFDTKGDLFIADEYYYSVLGLNTNASGTNTVNNVALPAGQIWKVVGTATGSTAPYCINGTASSSGCSDAVYTVGVQANSDEIRGAYSIAADASGNLYGGEEYYNSVYTVTSAGVLNNFAGIPNSAAKTLQRAAAGSFGIGSIFGIAADTSSNVYISDASNGVLWRVDGVGKSQYVVAGGATAVCASATDKYGDGCPATQAILGSSTLSATNPNFAATTLPGPGVYGVTVDKYANLFFGDTETNLVREIASGTQFGSIGENQPVTQTLDIHFAASDVPASGSPYTLAAGSSSVFTLGTPTCTLNSDATTDCLLPLTATATALGAFSDMLQVNSSRGATASFQLNGIAVMTPLTRISVAVSTATVSGCTGTPVYPTTASLTLTATIVSSGSPTGTVTFFANGTQIGTPQPVNKGVATLTNTFSTAGTYTITAMYSGDSYYLKSTSPSTVKVTTSAPTFTASAVVYQTPSVVAGGTSLYSFNVVQNVYTGTINMACSSLPSGASCTFSPQTITSTGCSNSSVVALSILTQQGPVSSGLGVGGSGAWPVVSLVAGFGLALLIGIRRRQTPMRFGQLWMVLALLIGASGLAACGKTTIGGPATPSGTYHVTVTATGSTGTTSTFPVTLTVQ